MRQRTRRTDSRSLTHKGTQQDIATDDGRRHHCHSLLESRIFVEPIHSGLGSNGVNDPSAGSPTETLLRLLLPLNDKV